MKKYLLSLFPIMPLLALSQASMKTKKVGELIIQGKVSYLKEPVNHVYIISLDGSKEGFDSVKVINNQYRICIQTGATTLVTLYAKTPADPANYKDKYMLTIVAEPTTIIISSTDSFSNAKITGSSAYPEYKLLKERADTYGRQIGIFIKDKAKSEQLKDKEGTARLNKKIDSTLLALNTNVYYDYIKKNPTSIIMNFALNAYARSLKDTASDQSVEEVALIYSKLSTNDQESYFGRGIKKKIDSYKIRIGMMAPEIIQTDFLGKPVSLTSFKGKYVLLDFWASWCGPCRRDFPQVKELYREYSKYGFEIIGISKDTDTTAYLKAIEQDGINLWANTLFNEQIMKSYFVEAIPVKILIDPKGFIIGIWRGGNDENFNALMKMIENNIKKQSNFQQ